MTPRLVTLAQARKRLGGLHPTTIGVQSIHRKWDMHAIEAALDRLSGLMPQSPPAAGERAANDDTDELDSLAQRIADAARGA
jgi:hypothetical protein